MRLFRPKGSVNLKLIAAFVFAIGVLVAQDASTSYMNPNVLRAGEKLSCRCGGCRNTVGSCPMLHCEFSDPMRHRIASMQSQGQSDQQIVDTIVREQGIVALSTPTREGWGLFTWIMPAVAAFIGFLIYSLYVKRNQEKTPAALTPVDQEVLQRFHDQIDRELEEDPETLPKRLDQEK
jgi:cytochrome c-type biogenesis protein CcmH